MEKLKEVLETVLTIISCLIDFTFFNFGSTIRMYYVYFSLL